MQHEVREAEPQQQQQQDEERRVLLNEVDNLRDKVAQLEAESQVLREKIQTLQRDNAKLQCGPQFPTTSRCVQIGPPQHFVASYFG